MLAVAMNGQPLPVAHGFPVRTVVPGLYGYVSACKWITDIEVTTYRKRLLLGPARLVDHGADQDRVADRRARPARARSRPAQTAIAGVAWAQHKGIDAVEVRVDRGPLAAGHAGRGA